MARNRHSLTAFSLGPGVTEVMEFGGSDEQYVDSEPMADTTLLQFSKSKLPVPVIGWKL